MKKPSRPPEDKNTTPQGPRNNSYPARSTVKPIMFLSRGLKDAEKRYWLTKLEVAELVWAVKKVRHLIESSSKTIVFIDYSATVNIAKQQSLETTSTSKINLRLIRASEYLQQFDLDVRHKPNKTNVVPDALSRLASANTSNNTLEEELNILHGYEGTASLILISDSFKQKIRDGYKNDTGWFKILDQVKANDTLQEQDRAQLPFALADPDSVDNNRPVQHTNNTHAEDLLYYINNSDGSRRLCIPSAAIQDILAMAHNFTGHQGFDRVFKSVSNCCYIRGLFKVLREYLHHCPQYQVYQTKRYMGYSSLQPIATVPQPFHTLSLDFILGLPTTNQGLDAILSITDKFTKRISLIPGKTTHSAKK